MAGLQHVGQRVARAGRVGLAAQDRKDRADADVHVDVARAVERIEDDDVLAVLAVALDDDRLLVLLRSHDRHVAAVAQAVQQRLVGEHVELLHRLALHVLLAGRAEDVDQPGPADLRGDDLGGQRDAGQQPGELAAGLRMIAAAAPPGCAAEPSAGAGESMGAIPLTSRPRRHRAS